MNKKAVSPIIATLLLVAIAVSAAVVTYTWTMSMVTNQASQAQTQIRIDVVEFTDTQTVEITVRNTGTMAATIEKAYLMTGTAVTQTGTVSGTLTVSPSGVSTITAEFDASSFADNKPYQIRLVTTNGYVVEGVYYTQSSVATPSPSPSPSQSP
jgi:flagellin-like protein